MRFSSSGLPVWDAETKSQTGISISQAMQAKGEKGQLSVRGKGFIKIFHTIWPELCYFSPR
jgi:hypothetical protein